MTAVLQTRGLCVTYGGVRAVTDVDIELGGGQLVGLIGPNGAGKTSFIDAVAGFARSTGRVLLDGHDVSTLDPHQRARRGFARTWQAVELFDDLSVRENLVVSSRRPKPWETVREVLTGRAREDRRVQGVLELLGIPHLADLQGDQLTQTRHRKLVGIARALVADPQVLCLDEPAAGLDMAESGLLGKQLREIVDRGTAVLLVDHDMGLVLSVCNTVVVLEFGKVIAAGPAEQVRSDPRVIAAYLGATAAPPATPPTDRSPR
jgi:branched-chain amino acid transport system ATP-binding protein